MAIDSESLELLQNLGFGAAVLISVCLIFDLLRWKYPRVYFYREVGTELPENDDYNGRPMYAPPRPSSLPFGWVKPVLMYDERTFVGTHGLDAAMHVRWLRTQATMFAVLSVYALFILLPTYGTGMNQYLRKGESERMEGVAILSLSNVGNGDGRLWGTLVSELFVIAVVTYFMRRELHAFKTYRLSYRADSLRNPSNYAVIVLDVPEESQSKELIRRFFARCLPGEVSSVHHIRDAENLYTGKSKIVAAMKKRERAQWKLIKAVDKKPDDDHTKLEDKLTEALDKQREAEREYRDMLDDLDTCCPLTHAAIVVFYSKRAATVAASTVLWNNASEWRVERAAEPKAVNWNRIEITSWTSLIRSLTSLFLVTAFAAFWFLPVAAIQSLKNLRALSEDFEFMAWLGGLVKSTNIHARNYVWLVQGTFPPLLLFIFLQLVPMLFRFIIGFERIASLGSFEAKIRSHLFIFYVCSNFFYVVISGSVLDELASLVRQSADPREILIILSRTVPKQATFLMKYVLINSFLGSAMGLLNIGRLLFRPLMMTGARTTRAKMDADALWSEYPSSKMYALTQMIGFIALVYSTIAPLICVVACLYFGIAYVCTKFVIMYSHRPFFESGGKMYPGAWYALLSGLYLHQLVLVGIFTLKLAIPQAVIATLGLLPTLGFSVYCFKSFFRIAAHGSLMDQLDADDRAGLIDKVPEHFNDLYVHPGMKPFEETVDLTGLPRHLRYDLEAGSVGTSSSSSRRRKIPKEPSKVVQVESMTETDLSGG